MSKLIGLPLAGDDSVPGEISTSRYSPVAIAIAKSAGLLRVDANGLGWIHDMEPDLSDPAPSEKSGGGK